MKQGREVLREPRDKGYRSHTSQSASLSATELIEKRGECEGIRRHLSTDAPDGMPWVPFEFRRTKNAQNWSNTEFESWAMNARALESLKRALREPRESLERALGEP